MSVPLIREQVGTILQIPLDGWTDDMLMGAYIALGVCRQRGVGLNGVQNDLIEATRSWVLASEALNRWESTTGWSTEQAPLHLLDAVEGAEDDVFDAYEEFDRWERKVAR